MSKKTALIILAMALFISAAFFRNYLTLPIGLGIVVINLAWLDNPKSRNFAIVLIVLGILLAILTFIK